MRAFWVLVLFSVLSVVPAVVPSTTLADTAVGDADVLFEQGIRYVDRGYYTLGVSFLEKAVAANRNHFDAAVLLADHIIIDERGVRYASKLRNERAAELYQHALTLQPDSPHALNNYAWFILQTKGDPKLALIHSKKAVSLIPDRVEYLDTLAAAYCEAGLHADARATLSHALTIAPDASFLLRRKERICSKEPVLQ